MQFTNSFYCPQWAAHVGILMKQLDTPAQDFIHWTVGLVGEVIEYEHADGIKNAHEEIGDCMFYLEAGAQWLGRVVHECARSADAFNAPFDRPENLYVDSFWHGCAHPVALVTLREHAGVLLDYAKKAMVYNRPLDEATETKIYASLAMCWHALQRLMEFNGTGASTLREENYRKLRKRYPEGYTDTAAQARADKAKEVS